MLSASGDMTGAGAAGIVATESPSSDGAARRTVESTACWATRKRSARGDLSSMAGCLCGRLTQPAHRRSKGENRRIKDMVPGQGARGVSFSMKDQMVPLALPGPTTLLVATIRDPSRRCRGRERAEMPEGQYGLGMVLNPVCKHRKLSPPQG